MFEHKTSRLASKKKFRSRIANAVLLNMFILTFSLFIGIIGYHYFSGMRWIDAFLNASMILGGMGPVDALGNDSAKVFAGFYALFSGAVFLIGMGIVAAPILHRFMHKFHLDLDEVEKEKKGKKPVS